MDALILDYHNRFPFYRCNTKDGGCGRLTTELELSSGGGGYFCPCGNGSFRCTDLFWFEHLYPRVIAMDWALLTGKIIVDIAINPERLKPNGPLPLGQ